jgi:hypothetical protein
MEFYIVRIIESERFYTSICGLDEVVYTPLVYGDCSENEIFLSRITYGARVINVKDVHRFLKA